MSCQPGSCPFDLNSRWCVSYCSLPQSLVLITFHCYVSTPTPTRQFLHTNQMFADAMAYNIEQDSQTAVPTQTVVPTTALIAFVEAALALVNSGLAYLPNNELEHVTVQLEHAISLATEEAQFRQVESVRAAPQGQSAPAPLTPSPASRTSLGALERQVQSLSIQGLQDTSFQVFILYR